MLLLVSLFLPYTLLLTFGQCIRSLPTKKRCILWLTESTAFISIMDAYHAPYEKKHCYWTGLMLLIRCVLFIVLTSSNELLVKMYTTVLTLAVILTLKTFIIKVYKSFYINILESCFLMNTIVLSATLHYLGNYGSDHSISCKCVSASISVSMITFAGLLLYHAKIQITCCKTTTLSCHPY